MSYKNLGAGVSQNPQSVGAGAGQYSAQDHSWESVIFRQDSAITDWELNLLQDVHHKSRRVCPSAVIGHAFLDRNDALGAFTIVAADSGVGNNANLLHMPAFSMNVNGWPIRFEFTDTNTPGNNVLELPAPPGSGSRTDLVVLEVWRALVEATPSTDNKSIGGLIYRFGNVKAPDTVNLADDLVDPVLAAETTKRIQIQYRYRAISNVDVATHTDGIDAPSVKAHTVPDGSVDGTITAYSYSKSSSDPGLWIAGAGDSTAAGALGTVDGFMYAIPLFAVARRNSTAFSRTNLNGAGLMASGTSGRPDGLFADQIVERDILDMRRGLAMDYNEILDKAFAEILDGTINTSSPSHTQFVMDDLKPAGHTKGPDAVRSSFSDRCVTETVVAKVTVGGATSTVVFDVSALNIPWHGTVDLPALGSQARIVGYTRLRMKDAADAETDLIGGATYVQSAEITTNATPSDTLTLTLSAAVSSVDVYAELLIEFPRSTGLSKNIVEVSEVWTPAAASIGAWFDSATVSATIDADRFELNSSYWKADVAHRELSIKLKSTNRTWIAEVDANGAIFVPDVISGTPTMSTAHTVSSIEVNRAFTRIVLNSPPAAGTLTTVTYVALRPPPPVTTAPADSYNAFYTTRASQSLPVPAGTQTLQLIPRAISKVMHVFTHGSGSPDDAAPFVSPGALLPVGNQPASSFPESRLDNPSNVAIAGFSANSGHIQVPVAIPYSPNLSQVTLYSDGLDTTVDGDNRSFWPRSDSGTPTVYTPASYAPALSYKMKHKVALPVLMEVKSDFPSTPPYQVRQGTLVLVVFVRWFNFSDENSIQLLPTASDTCAAVFRTRGNLMSPRMLG